MRLRLFAQDNGVILITVLGVILVAVLLAGAIISIMASHNRLTLHQTSRIQAQYAGQAGINFALEMLRRGDWPMPANDSSYIRNLNEPDLPPAIRNVTITVSGSDVAGCDPPAGITVCVSASANYTYTP